LLKSVKSLNSVSPIGPISLDFGQALMKETYDQTEVMRVNFGTKF
jgi:outer membrane protein insertion porin family